MNAINVIKPYKWEGMWVFDDPRVELDHEPFVGKVPMMLESFLAIKGIKNAESGFLLLFSNHPFKDSDLAVEWVKYEDGGDVYRLCMEDMSDEAKSLVSEDLANTEGWLCPALRLYYSEAPRKLYLSVREVI